MKAKNLNSRELSIILSLPADTEMEYSQLESHLLSLGLGSARMAYIVSMAIVTDAISVHYYKDKRTFRVNPFLPLLIGAREASSES